jgi:hypothetical protein
MKNNESKINTEEAKAALLSIKEYESASLQQAGPPIWFGIVISLVVGLLVFLIGAGLRDYYLFPIIALPLIIAIKRSKMKASPRTITNKKTTITLVCFTGVMLGLIIGAVYIRALYSNMVGPIICSLIAILIVYWLSVSERNEYENSINKDIGK